MFRVIVLQDYYTSQFCINNISVSIIMWACCIDESVHAGRPLYGGCTILSKSSGHCRRF